MPIFKRCSRCGKRVPSGTACECIKRRHKEYDSIRNKDISSFYGSGVWQRKRQEAMELYIGNDIYSYYMFGKLEQADTVHHILPLKENWGKRLDIDNLIPLTNSNHEKLHYRMKNGEHDTVIQELKDLQERWKKECK